MWKLTWPDFKIPPINLWNVWPRKDQIDEYMDEIYNKDVYPITKEDVNERNAREASDER